MKRGFLSGAGFQIFGFFVLLKKREEDFKIKIIKQIDQK